MLYAEWYFARQNIQADGATQADHNISASEQMEKFGLKKPKDLIEQEDDKPELPVALSYLWDWFQQVRVGVTYDTNGGMELTWAQVEAWASLMRIAVLPWEADTLVLLGSMARNEAAREMARQLGK